MFRNPALWLSVGLIATTTFAQQVDDSTSQGDQTSAAAPNAAASIASTHATPNAKDAPGVASSAVGHSVTRRSGIRGGERGQVSRRAGGGSAWYADGLAALAVVLALIAVAALAVKKWGRKFRMAVGSGGENLELVSRLALSPKQSVCLIRLGRQLVLTGVTSEQITSLAVVDDAETVAEMLATAGRRGAEKPGGRFGRLFAGYSSGYNDGLHEPEPSAEVGLAVEDGEFQRARVELLGLLDKVRSRDRSAELGLGPDGEDRDGGTIAVA
jgi:flagellar biogenesis protein FliO